MKDKKQQSVSTLIKDYLRLTDEKVEIPLAIAATKEKISDALSKASGNSIKKSTAENLFKSYMHMRKLQERQLEIVAELNEVEFTLREFLSFIDGNKLAYEKKDNTEKQKVTYLFWLEDGVIKSNR